MMVDGKISIILNFIQERKKKNEYVGKNVPELELLQEISDMYFG